MPHLSLNVLADWNPQLARELKGRWNLRPLLTTAIASLGLQLVIVGIHLLALPQIPLPERSRYCTGELSTYSTQRADCVTNALGHVIIHWQAWWHDLFFGLSFVGIFLLIPIGICLLVGNLSHEESQGTLKFIRLSPQPAQNILLGKMLGVPILLYFGLALGLPLHLWAAFQAQISLLLLILFYGSMLASTGIFFSLALLYGLSNSQLGGSKALTGAGVGMFMLVLMYGLATSEGNVGVFQWLMLFSPILLLPTLSVPDLPSLPILEPLTGIHYIQFFSLPLGASVTGFGLLAIAHHALVIYGLWSVLVRIFHLPGLPWMSKIQGYCLTFYLNVCWLGFTLGGLSRASFTATDLDSQSAQLYGWQSLLALNLLLFLCLSAMVLPQRQPVLEWSRARHLQRTATGQRLPLWQDLLWGEKSPATGAIAVALLIMMAILLPGLLIGFQALPRTSAIGSLLIQLSLTLLYGAIAQQGLILRTPKRAAWALTWVAAAIFLPILGLPMASIHPTEGADLWLMSPIHWIALKETSLLGISLNFLAQMALAGLFTLQLSRQVSQMGSSDSKRLLTQSQRSL